MTKPKTKTKANPNTKAEPATMMETMTETKRMTKIGVGDVVKVRDCWTAKMHLSPLGTCGSPD